MNWVGPLVERFRFTCRHLKILKEWLFFHPSDEGLSPGTPEEIATWRSGFCKELNRKRCSRR